MVKSCVKLQEEVLFFGHILVTKQSLAFRFCMAFKKYFMFSSPENFSG